MLLSKKEIEQLSVKDSFEDARLLFWDVDVNELSFIDDIEYIIGRVISRFSLHDGALDMIDKVYPKEWIVEMCLSPYNEIYSNEMIKILGERYNIPLKKFIRYYSGK